MLIKKQKVGIGFNCILYFFKSLIFALQIIYILVAMAEKKSPISNFYQDRSILITGATGFMGKVCISLSFLIKT